MITFMVQCHVIRLRTNEPVSTNFRPKVLDEILRNLLSPQKRQGLAYQAIGTSVGGDHDQEGRAAEARQDLVSSAMYEGRRRLRSRSSCRSYDICIYNNSLSIYIYICIFFIRHMYIVYMVKKRNYVCAYINVCKIS